MAKLDAQGLTNLIETILSAINALGPAGVDLYLKLEQLFQLGPDEQANVSAAITAGIAADADTISAVEAWKKQVGL
jgi:hypothetical protein